MKIGSNRDREKYNRQQKDEQKKQKSRKAWRKRENDTDNIENNV